MLEGARGELACFDLGLDSFQPGAGELGEGEPGWWGELPVLGFGAEQVALAAGLADLAADGLVAQFALDDQCR